MKYRTIEDCDPEQAELLKTLIGLISIPSIKGKAMKSAPFGVETRKALKYILKAAGKMGFKTCDLEGYAGFIEFGEGTREIAVLCHLDVVPAGEGWKFDPFKPFIETGKLYGRGSIDDKGPAIAVLYAMKALKDSGYKPPCRIRLILGLDEESRCECIAYYKSRQPDPDCGFTPDAKFPVIFAEKGILHITISGRFNQPFPSKDTIIIISADGGERVNMIPAACKVAYIENPCNETITEDNLPAVNVKSFKGIPGHAMMPRSGENAISKAMLETGGLLFRNDIHNRFIDFYNRHIGMTTDGSLLGINYCDKETGDLTFNVGLLRMGKFNAITYNIEMALDVRYPASADVDFILSRIKECCSGYGLEVTGIENNLPLYVDKDSEIVQILLKIYNDVTGSWKTPIAIGGGTYARTMPNILAFGPCFSAEDDMAHQAGEYIRLDDLFLCNEIYQKAIVSLAEFIASKTD